MFNSMFDAKLYVRIYKNKIVVKNLTNNSPTQMFAPDVAFTTTRLLIGNFAPALTCMRQAIKSVSSKSPLIVRPIILLQPMEMCEGGLSEIEDKVLRECALGAGARKVIVWIGDELSNEKAIDKIKNSV